MWKVWDIFHHKLNIWKIQFFLLNNYHDKCKATFGQAINRHHNYKLLCFRVFYFINSTFFTFSIDLLKSNCCEKTKISLPTRFEAD